MQKGIIMEVRKENSVVLSASKFYKIKNKRDMAVGQEILFTEEDVVTSHSSKRNVINMSRYVAVVAALIMMLVFGATYHNNNIAIYTEVTMDINPSLQLSLNKKDEVVAVDALNDDGTVFEMSEIIGATFEEAVDLLLYTAVEEGYVVEGTETHVVFSTIEMKQSGVDKSKTLTAMIDAALSDDEEPILDNVTITVIKATPEQLEEAIETGLPTPVVVLDETLDLSEVTTVKELFENSDTFGVIKNNGKGQVVKESKQLEHKKSEMISEEPVEDPAIEDEQLEDTNSDTTGDPKDKVNNLGNSEESRGDLIEVISKLTYIKNTYGADESYAELMALVDDYLSRYDAGGYEFKPFKEEGQVLLKALRSEGLKTGEDELLEEGDTTSEVDEPEDAEDAEEPEDKTEEIQEKLVAISQLVEVFEAIPSEVRDKMSNEDAEHFDDWLLKASSATAEDGQVVLKDLLAEGQALKKLLREVYDIKGNSQKEDEETSEDASDEEDDEITNDGKGQDKEKTNNGKND